MISGRTCGDHFHTDEECPYCCGTGKAVGGGFDYEMLLNAAASLHERLLQPTPLLASDYLTSWEFTAMFLAAERKKTLESDERRTQD